MIHKLSDVQSKNIDENTNIWQYCVILSGAKIGSNCNICSHCFIENDVIIGNNVTIKCGVKIWDGIIIEDDVFIGPNVTFCNNKYLKSRNKNWKLEPIIIKKGVSIGANSTILTGVIIGENSIIGWRGLLRKIFLQILSSIQKLKQLLEKKYNIFSYIISNFLSNIKLLHNKIINDRVINELKILNISRLLKFFSIFNLDKTSQSKLFFFYKLINLVEV